MKLLVLYRPTSEHARVTEEFIAELKHRYPEVAIDVEDVDSPNGSRLVETYDILEYPSLLALDNVGSVVNIWVGSSLPLINDVAGYLNSSLP